MRKIFSKTKKCLAVLLLIVMLTSLFCIPTVSAANADMHISWRGIDLIKKYEGFHTYQYWDHQQWTIGYGTRCYNGQYPNGITVEQATADLQAALVKAENLLKEFLNDNGLEVNQNQFDALVSFAYNIGEYIWFTSDTFTLRNYLLDGIENHSAADFEYAFGLWCKAGGQTLDGLVRRRADEATLFNLPCATYTVSYDANGGTGAPAPQAKQDGETVYISKNQPTRPGYEFRGWATSADSSTVAYSGGSAYSAKANILLYAVWAKDNTITYDANGGVGAPAAQTKAASASITLDTTRPTRTGYTFAGWSKTKDSTTVDFAGGDSYAESKDVTLYAVWREMSVVCFDAQEGSFGETAYVYGDLNQDGVTNEADAYLLEIRMRMNTVWSAQDKAICDVDLNGKVDANDLLLVVKLVSGEIPSLPAKLYAQGASYTGVPKAQLEGKYLIGWSNKPGGDALSTHATVSGGVSTVYAVWSDRPMTGDIDTDGSITVSDILGLKKLILNSENLSEEQKLTGDVDGNGIIDVADILSLVGAIMG